METKETIILELQIDRGQSEKEVDSLTKAIEKTKSETEALTKANKDLKKSGQENSEEYLENAKQIELNKDSINKNSSSRKNLITVIKSEENTITALSAKNKQLIAERNKINVTTEEGRKKVAAINAELDKNNATIKENVSSTEKQKINIGNYASALDKVVPGLGGFVTKLGESTEASGGLVGGIKAMIKSSLAFIATPIGLVIAAVAAAVSLLSTWISRTTGGMDKFEDATAVVSTVLNVLIDRVVAFVGGLVKIMSGDFAEGFNEIGNSVKGIGDEMEREIGLALELNAALRELEDREIAYKIAVSELNNEIKNLLLQSKNRALSEKERIALTEQALALERQQADELVAIKLKSLQLIAEEAGATKNMYLQNGESIRAYAKRLIDSGELVDENRDKVVEAIIAVNEAEGETLNMQEKILNMQAALQEAELKNQENRAKEREDFEIWKQQLDERLNGDRRKYEEEAKQNEDRKKIAKSLSDSVGANAKIRMDFEKINTDFNKVQYDTDVKNYQAAQKAKQDVDRETKEALMSSAGTFWEASKMFQQATANEEINNAKNKESILLEQLQKRFDDGIITEEEYNTEKKRINDNFDKEALAIKKKAFEQNKRNQIVETIISTAQAAIAAYRALAGIPVVGPALGIIAAAAAATYGGAKVQLIKSQQFQAAKGGNISAHKEGTFRGPSHAQGGIDYISSDGRHRINVEGDENFYVLKKSASNRINALSNLNVAHGGVSWHTNRHPVNRAALGGLINTSVQQSGVSPIDIERIVKSTMENMPPTVVYVEEFESVQSQLNTTKNKAKLI